MPSMTQQELLRKAAGPVGTGDFDVSSGLLAPEQASAFLDLVYDATEFNALHRNERRRVRSGSIAKMGVGRRLLRKKTAGVDDATLQQPTFGEVEYATVRSRLDWEIEEEVFEENIEQEGLEDHLARLMGDQVGRDLEDLHFNGDTAAVVGAGVTADDVAFLSQNDGWLKQIAGSATAKRVNGATVNGGVIVKDHFFDALEAMPTKYKRAGGLRWIGTPTLFDRYAEGLSNRATAAGDAILINGQVTQIMGYPIVRVSAMPNTRLLLADPRNFIVVNTRDIRRRKTTEGRQAIRQDKRFYAIFLDDDPIIEEQGAIADVHSLAA